MTYDPTRICDDCQHNLATVVVDEEVSICEPCAGDRAFLAEHRLGDALADLLARRDEKEATSDA